MIYMVYLFHKKLLTSSTNTLIKNNKVSHHHKGHSKRTSPAKSGFFEWVVSHFFWLQTLPLRHLLLFLSTFPPLFTEWCTFWMVPYFCHIITFFPTKVFFFRKHPLICVLKNSFPESFWIIPSKLSTLELF